MSSEAEEVSNDDTCCASCGIAEGDDIKLKKCTACQLVRYCGVECQREHRSKHKKACKKRVAEMHDEILFQQPESSHLGDCPICCLPLPLDFEKSTMAGCCSKMFCLGCDLSNKIREGEQSLDQTCPFCRHPSPKTDAEADENRLRRVEANDPVALREMGTRRHDEGDYKSAVEYWTKAAELGDINAYHDLANAYMDGEGVERDMNKAIYHWEKAAIGGHHFARYNLGYAEERNGRMDRAAKHHIIAANLGYDGSMKRLRQCYQGGWVSKEDFAATLRAHQAAVDATKSPQREAAEAEYDAMLSNQKGK
jgi:hypothetical protein